MLRALWTYGKRGMVMAGWLLAIVFIFSACNTTKFVPQDKCLLNKARVTCDDPAVPTAQLRGYLRQKQNSEIFGFWKLQLHIYNTAPTDTTTKSKRRMARNAHKMGEEPVIYDDELTQISMQQLRQQMNNMGYFHAEVDTIVKVKDRKVDLTYTITAHQPYKVRKYEVDIDFEGANEIGRNERCMVHSGDQFSTDVLDDERDRITSALRNKGYFYFEKSMLEFTADSSLNTHEVDVRIHLAPFVSHLDKEALKHLHTQYSIRNVEFSMDRPFLRKGTLRRACRIRSGDRYSEIRVERTYARMNALPPVKYVDIAFTPVGDSLLDCSVTVSKGKLHSVSADVEGTYSGGDWGVAAGLNYSNKNIFRGAEILTIGGRGSYEWRTNGGRAIEGKADVGLLFPSNVKLNVAYNYQHRPDEYTRTIVNAGLAYLMPKEPRSHWTHRFDFLDINYIYVPWMSQAFIDQFLNRSTVLKSSYESHFILDWGYTGVYSSYNQRYPNRSFVQFSIHAETGGNALYAISKWANLQQNKDQQYMLWRIPFAQYAKGDLNFTFHGIIFPEHHLLAHVGLGVAVPYLNSSIIPFQKRYFGGGAHSIRGWQARTLGPGAFRSKAGGYVYDLQVGDIKLDMNLEYRYKVLRFLELAAFVDAGNIWTIRDYGDEKDLSDPLHDGLFKFDEFYKQIAWSYGVGIRFDLSLFIFRIDFGVKLHDPSRIKEGKQWRTAPNGLCWKEDMTLHFAVGYPF